MQNSIATSAAVVNASAQAATQVTTVLSAHSNSIVQQLDALSTKRQAWEVTDFKKANEGLYNLLGECLDVFNGKFVNASDEDKRSLRQSLTELLTVKGVRVLKNTNTLTMFVRFVFGSDRKRAHGYSYVLKAAISHGVEAADLAAWLVGQGGIEEVKRRMVQSEEAIKRNLEVEAAKVAVQAEMEVAEISPLATVQIPGLKGEYVLMLAKPSADGKATVIATLSDVADHVTAQHRCHAHIVGAAYRRTHARWDARVKLVGNCGRAIEKHPIGRGGLQAHDAFEHADSI